MPEDCQTKELPVNDSIVLILAILAVIDFLQLLGRIFNHLRWNRLKNVCKWLIARQVLEVGHLALRFQLQYERFSIDSQPVFI